MASTTKTLLTLSLQPRFLAPVAQNELLRELVATSTPITANEDLIPIHKPIGAERRGKQRLLLLEQPHALAQLSSFIDDTSPTFFGVHPEPELFHPKPIQPVKSQSACHPLLEKHLMETSSQHLTVHQAASTSRKSKQQAGLQAEDALQGFKSLRHLLTPLREKLKEYTVRKPAALGCEESSSESSECQSREKSSRAFAPAKYLQELPVLPPVASTNGAFLNDTASSRTDFEHWSPWFQDGTSSHLHTVDSEDNRKQPDERIWSRKPQSFAQVAYLHDSFLELEHSSNEHTDTSQPSVLTALKEIFDQPTSQSPSESIVNLTSAPLPGTNDEELQRRIQQGRSLGSSVGVDDLTCKLTAIAETQIGKGTITNICNYTSSSQAAVDDRSSMRIHEQSDAENKPQAHFAPLAVSNFNQSNVTQRICSNETLQVGLNNHAANHSHWVPSHQTLGETCQSKSAFISQEVHTNSLHLIAEQERHFGQLLGYASKLYNVTFAAFGMDPLLGIPAMHVEMPCINTGIEMSEATARQMQIEQYLLNQRMKWRGMS